jgi:RNA polymerase sigma-70 factor, ECF subfamily
MSEQFDKRHLSELLLSLDPDDRTVLVRAYYLRQSVQDIAAYIAACERISTSVVRSRLHNALSALRTYVPASVAVAASAITSAT